MVDSFVISIDKKLEKTNILLEELLKEIKELKENVKKLEEDKKEDPFK